MTDCLRFYVLQSPLKSVSSLTNPLNDFLCAYGCQQAAHATVALELLMVD